MILTEKVKELKVLINQLAIHHSSLTQLLITKADPKVTAVGHNRYNATKDRLDVLLNELDQLLSK